MGWQDKYDEAIRAPLLAEIERLRDMNERDLVDVDEVWTLFCHHYWDSFQKDRDLILCHVEAVLRMARQQVAVEQEARNCDK